MRARVVVVKARNAGLSDLARPVIQPVLVWLRVVAEKIFVLPPDKEPLIVNRVGRGWQ